MFMQAQVLDALRSPPCVLRPGGVTAEALSELPGLTGLQVGAHGVLVNCISAGHRKPAWEGL